MLETEELSETAKQDILNSGSVEMQENGPNPAPTNPEEAKEEDSGAGEELDPGQEEHLEEEKAVCQGHQSLNQ